MVWERSKASCARALDAIRAIRVSRAARAMRVIRIILILMATLPSIGGAPTVAEELSGDTQLLAALRILGSIPTGQQILERARDFWQASTSQELASHFQWGSVSRTDAVLTRHFDPVTGKQRQERQVTVFLKRGQRMADLVLDLAHELTHATGQPSWDPYDPELTPGRYIRAALEEKGGEVDALVVECQVGRELSLKLEGAVKRCRPYFTHAGEIQRERVRRDFYRVGKWHGDLKEELGSEQKQLPLLSADKPELYSSTGRAPYPVALFWEYEEITSIACRNSRQRIRSLAREPGRLPASVRSATERFLDRRCASLEVTRTTPRTAEGSPER